MTWTVTGTHTFTAGVVIGAETDMGAIIAKAKLKIDAKIEKSWTSTRTQTVSDTNNTDSGYRAVLGQVGWRLTTTKSWIVTPCKTKTSNIVLDTPRVGDLSIGREAS